MSLYSVQRSLVNRLEEDTRGDRGWWILTRVHVSAHWIRGIAEYLEQISGGSDFTLSTLDYNRLGTIIESDAREPGQQLRRHHLLVMDKPLQLLERLHGNKWRRLRLTEQGRQLAHTDDISPVLERSLQDIRFARTPWSPTSRVNGYPNFDVPVYDATVEVLRRTQGFIDRNEFDFFLSRIRNLEEVKWAIDSILAYRQLSEMEQESLHSEVRDRLPSEKSYLNWRDMGHHTFSLFSLGTSMMRAGSRLLLTDEWVQVESRRNVRSPSLAQGLHDQPMALRIPVPPSSTELNAPPAAPASNDGTEAESFVAKVLRSQGWQIVFYTNRRGFGFDLWANKNRLAMLVEVKSSVGKLGTVTLTRMEYLAAKKYGRNFVLAVVEDMADSYPRLTMIQDPVRKTNIVEQSTLEYRISRDEWLRAANIRKED